MRGNHIYYVADRLQVVLDARAVLEHGDCSILFEFQPDSHVEVLRNGDVGKSVNPSQRTEEKETHSHVYTITNPSMKDYIPCPRQDELATRLCRTFVMSSFHIVLCS